MNFVFVVGGYMPVPSSNTVCMINIMRELKKNNHNVRLIAINDGCTDPGEFDCKYVQPAETKKKTFFEYLKCFFVYSRYNKGLVKNYYDAIVEIDKEIGIDYLVCVHSGYEAIKAGQKAKKYNKKIKCVGYYLDAAEGVIEKLTLKERIVLHTLKKDTKQLIKDLDLILIPEYWKGEYSNNMCFVGKNVKFVGLPNLTEEKLPSNVCKDKIKIVYCGYLYKTIRGVECIKDFSRLLDINKNIEIHFYSKGKEEELNEFYKKYPNNVFLHGYVDRATIEKVLQEANYFLNISNRVTTYVPGKLFEYLSYAKPIINYQYIDNDPTMIYINKYDLAYNLIDGKDTDINDFNRFIEENKFATLDYENVKEAFKECLPTHSIKLMLEEN